LKEFVFKVKDSTTNLHGDMEALAEIKTKLDQLLNSEVPSKKNNTYSGDN